MRSATAASLATLLTLAACASPAPLPPPATVVAPQPVRAVGLERVVGQDARALVTLFGPADQDVTEGTARRLQFASAICILDAYLYPSAKGKEPIVTYVDARQTDGTAIDKASCVAAITRRREAR